MRRLRSLFLLLALQACGDKPRPAAPVPSGIGPDAVLVRVPSAGGFAVAYHAGSDSALWTSRDRAPVTEGLIGFDDFGGVVLGTDRQQQVFAIDLRLGSVTTLGTERLRNQMRAEGASVFGFGADGRILRITQAGTWNWQAPTGVDDIVPNADGALLLVTHARGGTTLRRLIPPDTRVLDSASLPRVRRVLRTAVGDRIWFDTDSGLIAVRARELTRALTVRVRDSVVAMEATPSGDRVYLATERPLLRIVDRFAGAERGTVELPRRATALRMDPDGNYLLARPDSGDAIMVVSIGTQHVIATLDGAWRDDLPLVTPDGGVLLARGRDVVLVDGATGRDRMRYRDGAADRWQLLRWNGFRPRAAGLDIPVEFEEFRADSAAADSALAALMAARYGNIGGITRADEPAPAPRQPLPPPAPRADGRGTWTVSFATLLSEERAQDMAERIRVDGRTARVVGGSRDGVPIWRVVLGPYDTREAAERAGMASRLPYWVFEGAP